MIGLVDSLHKPTRRPSSSSSSIASELIPIPNLSLWLDVEDRSHRSRPTSSAHSTTSNSKGMSSSACSSNNNRPPEGKADDDEKEELLSLGYESDEATAVTSNTGPQQLQLTDKDERWNTGANTSKVGPRRGSCSATTRRTSASTGSNSSAAGNNNAKKEDSDAVAQPAKPFRNTVENREESSRDEEQGENTTELQQEQLDQQQEEEAEEDEECYPDDRLDLRSKPGFINVSFDDGDLDHDIDNDGEPEEALQHSSSCGASATPSQLSQQSPPQLILTQERVRAFLKDYYEDFDSIFRHGKSSKSCWDAFFKQYFTKDILWVRSSSNTIGQEELAHHFAHDIVGIRMQLVRIDSIQILAGGLAAVVVFTADQKFVYRGTPNSDRTVITMVLHVEKGREIRIGHEHRCVGKPIPKDTRWD